MAIKTGMFCYCGAVLLVLYTHLQSWPLQAILLLIVCAVPRVRRLALCALMAVMLAQIHAGGSLDRALAQRLGDERLDQIVQAQGQIDDLIDSAPSQWQSDHICHQFGLRVNAISGFAGERSPTRLQISFCDHGKTSLLPGDQLVAQLRLRPMRARLNQAGSDSERSALAAGVDGYAVAMAVTVTERPAFSLNRWRQLRIQQLRATLPSQSAAAVLLPALIAGDRRYIQPSQWWRLQHTGVAHLVAISGLHVGLVALLVWWCLSRLLLIPMAWRQSVAVARQWALWPALTVALAYCALAGFALPTQRAMVMLVLVLGSVSGHWPIRPSSALLTAVTLILIWQPLAALSAGLWLSVLAVAIILAFQSAGQSGIARLQIMLSMATGLICSWLFGFCSGAAVLANLVLVPAFSLVIIPLALIGALLPVLSWAHLICAVLLEGSWQLLGWLAQVPALPAAPTLAIATLSLVAIVRCGLVALPGPRWLYLTLLLPWLVPPTARPPADGFDLVTFDVGQGQMQLLRTANHALLYDSGPSSQHGDTVRSTLMPWMAQQRVRLDLVIHSHGDSDHTGGLTTLRQLLPQTLFLGGQPARTDGHFACRRGQRWRWDGVHIEVLWPPAGISLQQGNNHSCVLWVHSASGSALLGGDMEQPVEYWLAQQRWPASVDLLLVPHHGSETSSSYTLLHHLRPTLASVSSGYGNRFGHPAPSIRARYRELGIAFYNTAETGMQRYQFRSGQLPSVQCWRQQSSWPWRQSMPVIE